jgi:alpha-tubulin suppressor-like RCC1 family protein
LHPKILEQAPNYLSRFCPLAIWGSSEFEELYTPPGAAKVFQPRPRPAHELKDHRPVSIAFASGQIFVVTGTMKSCQLLKAAMGDLVSWGVNTRGELGHSSIGKMCTQPTPVALHKTVYEVACGRSHVLCLTGYCNVYLLNVRRERYLELGGQSSRSTWDWL